MRMGEAAVVACLVAAAAASVAGQQQYPSHFSASLAARPDVQRALAFIDDRFAAQVKEWIALTEIPGTSTHEARSRRDFFGADVNDEPRYRRDARLGSPVSYQVSRGPDAAVDQQPRSSTSHPQRLPPARRRRLASRRMNARHELRSRRS